MKTRTFVSAFGLALLLGASSLLAGGNTISTGEMLRGVVHLTDDDVRFRTSEGSVIFVDPVSWPTDELVVASGMVKPDLILITHPHADHFQPTIIREYLSLNPKAIVIGPPEVVAAARANGINAQEVHPSEKHTVAGISFMTVPSFLEAGNSHPKAKQWVGYILQVDGLNHYVTGDTQPFPEMASLKVDVLFPLLSGCGGNIDEALKMCEMIHPRLVVPVHTSGQEATIKKFVQRLPGGVAAAYYRNGGLVAGS